MFLLVLFICFNIVAGVTGTGCPVVVGGTCTACSDKDTCTAADCTQSGFSVNEENKCTECGEDVQLTFNLFDSWGDGWNGASLTVKHSGGPTSYIITMDSGSTTTESLCVSRTEVVTLEWSSGDYDNECSYEVKISADTILAVGTAGATYYCLDEVCCDYFYGSGCVDSCPAGISSVGVCKICVDYFHDSACVDSCPVGMGASNGECETCPAGKFSSSDACVSCPVGEYSLAGSASCRDLSVLEPADYRRRLNDVSGLFC